MGPIGTEFSRSLALEPSVWFFAGQTDPAGPVRRVEISQTPMTIGRREDAALTLPCPSVSKEHAEIFEHAGRLWVRDLDSTNGTYLNGQPVAAPMPLTEGDIIQFATMVFRIGCHSEKPAKDNATVCHDTCDQALSLMQFDRLIEGEAVIPFYQPIILLSDLTRPALAFEVLGRSRLIGLETPGAMFATAAQLNLEAELSRIFRRQGVEVAQQFPVPVCLYVNSHPREIEDGSMHASLRELRKSNPTQSMVLEIHESCVTDAAEMRELRDQLTSLDIGPYIPQVLEGSFAF